jgi:ABC-type uncharacterized transport system involved in gliding motility auxiliary subunit
MKIWSPLFGALGFVGLVFGLLSVFLGLAGAPTDLSWIVANFGIGLFFLLLWVSSGLDRLRERLASGEARRAGKYGSAAIASTGASLAIIGMLAFLSTRYEKRFDWSEAGVHSLSPQSKEVLAQLEQDVEVVALYPPLETPRVRELLDRYAYESERFRVLYADPNARPDLVERYGIESGKLADGLVRIAIGSESVEVDEPSEEKVTNALVKLTRRGEKKVYFSEGHGERILSGEGADEASGLSRAADALRNENYRVESLILAARGEVPADADVVVVAGATRPFLPEELSALERYVEGGGALLVLVDPRAGSNLAPQLDAWGVRLGDDVIVDRVQGLFGRATTPFAGEYGQHPITDGLREITMFHVARSVKQREGSRNGFVELVRTGSESWGETDLEVFFTQGRAELGPDDVRGPVPVAVAGSVRGRPKAEPEAPAAGEEAAPAESDGHEQGRLAVYGDSDFATNQLLDAYRNRDLFVNTVNWLLGDVEFITIRPQPSRASRLQLSTQQLSRIRYLSLFVLPEAIAIVGVFAWWSRRRAPGR